MRKGAGVSEQSTVPVVAFHVAATGHATNLSNRKGLNALQESAACGRARSGCRKTEKCRRTDGGVEEDGWSVLRGYTSPADGFGFQWH